MHFFSILCWQEFKLDLLPDITVATCKVNTLICYSLPICIMYAAQLQQLNSRKKV